MSVLTLDVFFSDQLPTTAKVLLIQTIFIVEHHQHQIAATLVKFNRIENIIRIEEEFLWNLAKILFNFLIHLSFSLLLLLLL